MVMVSRKRVFSVFLVITLMCSFIFGMAGDINIVHADEISDLEAKIKNLEANNKKLSKNLTDVKGKLESEQEQQDILKEKIANTTSQIQLYEQKIKVMETNIATKEGEIGDKLVAIEESEELFAQRVRAMYIAGSSSVLNTLFSAESFSQFLTRAEVLKRISINDTDLINSLNTEKEELAAIKADMELQNKNLTATKAEFTAKSNELNQFKKESEAAEAELMKVQEKYYNEKKANEKQIKANDAAIDKILAERAAKNSGSSGPEGAYKWPVPSSSRVTSPFGWRTIYGKQERHLGIDIGAPAGTSIVAANDGEVVMVNKHSYGYGWHVVIDHGGNQATLYAHTSRIDVKVGDKVKRGQVIAGVGTTGASTGNHLHFEVRIGGVKMDPMGYVKKPS